MIRSFTAIIILLLISCGEKVIKEPEHLIPSEKMVDMLYDLALIHAAKSTNPKILEEHNIEPTKLLFEKYGVDSLQFVKSDVYYASIPLQYEAIYESVASRLEKNKADIEAERKRKKDSTLKQSETKQQSKKAIKKIAQDTLP